MKVLDYLPLYAGVLLLQLVAVFGIALGRIPEAWSWPFLLAWSPALAVSLVIGYRSRFRSAVAGQVAQLTPLVIAGVLLWAWISVAGMRFLFIACALSLVVGRNVMLSTRRNLYIDLAIVLALFYDALGAQRGNALVVLEIAFLVVLVFVLMADYADRRLAYANANEYEVRRALLPGLGNAALSTVMVLGLAAGVYLLLPQPESIGLGFLAPDATTRIEPSGQSGRTGVDQGSKAAPGGSRGLGDAAASGARVLSLLGDEGGGVSGGGTAAGEGSAAGAAGTAARSAAGGDDSWLDRAIARVGMPRVLATVDAPQFHYARAAIYSVAEPSAWRESADIPVARFGAGRFDLRQQGLESTGLVQTWTLKRDLGRDIPAALQAVHLQYPAPTVEVRDGQALGARFDIGPGTRYRVISSVHFADGRPAGVVEPSPGGRCADLPAGAERVRELAARLAAGQPDAQSRAEAIESWLRQNRRHGKFSGDNDNPVDAFLFERVAGGAPQFAAALASLLRAAGIESRIVSGYRVRRFNPLRGEFEIWESDRHVWVEAWLNARWRTFDAAPWATIPGDTTLPDAWASALDYVQLARHDDFGVRRPAGQRPADWYLALVLVWAWFATFGPWLVLAGVIAVLLWWLARRLLPPVFDNFDLLRLRFASREPRRLALAAFDVIERVFARRGTPLLPGENHVEYLHRLRQAVPALENRLETLQNCFSEARYGARFDPEMGRVAATACRDIVRVVDERLG
jgi:transglutaminase-like putative cysteine protease